MNIDIFDEHHEVMLFWNDISHKLNKKVLHVDFHSDMWTPGEPINYQFSKSPGFLTESLYQENIRDFVENNLSPTDFMIPSILRFRFDGVVHLKPVGEDIVHNDYCIGSLFGQGKIIRNVTEENKDFFPDNIKYSFFETTDVKKINWDDYLLDIDLDYFCCNMNPVSCHSLKTKYNNYYFLTNAWNNLIDFSKTKKCRYIVSGLGGDEITIGQSTILHFLKTLKHLKMLLFWTLDVERGICG